MKRFLIGGTIGLVIIAVGVGMSMGKIKVPKIVDISILDNKERDNSSLAVVITEEKSETQVRNVNYTFSVPKIMNAPVLERNIQDKIEFLKKDISDLAKEVNFEGESSNYSLNISYEVIRNDEKLVVIKIAAYEYTGGAHGNPSFAFFIYDSKSKRMIGEEEIFIDKNNPKLISFIADALLSKPEFSFDDEGKKTSVFFESENRDVFLQNIKDSVTPTLSKEGVLFKFGAYGIGPYVIGEPQIEIPYNQISEFLTPYAQSFFQ